MTKKLSTSKMRNEIVYPNLKCWMNFNKINAFQLSRLVGCSNTCILDYLEGRTQSLKLIKKIKLVTHLRYEDLIEQEGKQCD